MAAGARRDGAAELSDALERRSGLLALAGTADMREVVARRGAASLRRALASTSTSIGSARSIGAMAASLGGIDALVFTGGVGERSPQVRAAATDGLGLLGDAVVLVIEAREDVEIARGVRSALG